MWNVPPLILCAASVGRAPTAGLRQSHVAIPCQFEKFPASSTACSYSSLATHPAFAGPQLDDIRLMPSQRRVCRSPIAMSFACHRWPSAGRRGG